MISGMASVPPKNGHLKESKTESRKGTALKSIWEIKYKYQSRLDRVDSDRIIYKKVNDDQGELKSIRIEVDYFFWTREYLITPMPVNQKNVVDLFPSGSVYDLDEQYAIL